FPTPDQGFHTFTVIVSDPVSTDSKSISGFYNCPTATSVSTGGNLTYGQSYTITGDFNATGPHNASFAIGTMAVYIDGALRLFTTPDANGSASLNLRQLPPGSYTMKAVYTGDNNTWISSSSGDAGFTIAKADTTVALTASPAN